MRISDWSSDVCSSDRRCLIAPASSGKTAAVEGGNAGMLLFGIDQPRPLDPQSTFGIAYGGGIGCRVDAKQGGACRHCRAFFEKTAFENAGNTGVDVHFALDLGDCRIGEVERTVLLRSEEHTSELQSLMRISY